MKFEDALRFNGFTITQADAVESTIATASGTIVIPAMRLSQLTWQRPGTPEPWDSFYFAALPLFDNAYCPVLLSHILDRFASRRISYDTPDNFGRAVRRWLNLNMGAMSVWNKLYISTAVALPLTTQDATIDRATGSLSRDAHSDFPQGQLSGNLDYATDATDQAVSGTDDTNYQGRMNVSVMALLAEQRAAYLNVDELVLDAIESLFLGVFDQDETEDGNDWDYAPYGYGVFDGYYC
jgi:hypothetical protein